VPKILPGTSPNGVRFNPGYPAISRSDDLYARALGLIPAATQTLAKGPGQWVRGVAPKYLLRGRGCHVWDVDGNEYVDWQMGVGPLVLGYGHERVDAAIRAQLEQGITFSLMHPLEVEVAELVRELVPNAQAVRFSKTGCDVTTAAVRLARAWTGRDRVLCCGYHGWHDWYVATTERSAGVPTAVAELTATFGYNDLPGALAAIDRDTACVILEPVTFEPPRDGFLAELSAACEAAGALLVFDEMWTGFRLALGGAQEHFGVVPDLACFSKAVANGMPLSVLTGRRDVMALLEREVFFFTTFGGEALSLAAAKATLCELRDRGVPASLARQGRRLAAGYDAIARELGVASRAVGYPCRTLVTFDPAAGDPLLQKSLVQQEMIRRGVLWSGFHNLSLAHADADVDHTLAAYREALAVLAAAIDAGDLGAALDGEPVEPVFRKTGGFHTKPLRAAAR
jgi:glutamate-1-semialdehyde aminotransferase